MKTIVVDWVYPPVPSRDYDWCAYYDGEEELGDYGYGRTPRLARYDLLSQTSRWGQYLYAIEDLREGIKVVEHVPPSRFVIGVQILFFDAWIYLRRKLCTSR